MIFQDLDRDIALRALESLGVIIPNDDFTRNNGVGRVALEDKSVVAISLWVRALRNPSWIDAYGVAINPLVVRLMCPETVIGLRIMPQGLVVERKDLFDVVREEGICG